LVVIVRRDLVFEHGEHHRSSRITHRSPDPNQKSPPGELAKNFFGAQFVTVIGPQPSRL
jgi:hypothetical protein